MFSVSRTSSLVHQICLNKRIGLHHVVSFELPSNTLECIYLPRNSFHREFSSLQRNIFQSEFEVNSLYFHGKRKFYPFHSKNIRYLSWNAISTYLSGSSKKGEEMKSSTTVSDVTASSENSSTDMKPDSNIVADSCSDEIGTQLLTDYPQQILEFFHTQLHMPVWSGLIVLTCGFCVSTTLLYVGVVRLLQGFILPIKVGNTMEKLLVYRGAQIDGFRGGSILSILRCNHFFSILQAGLLFTVVLNGIHGQHTVESNAVSMHNGGIFWFTDLTACDLYGALPLITCITYFCAWRVRDYILLEDTDPELETKLAATVASPFVYRTALSKSNDVSLLPNFPFSKMLMLSMNRLYGMITFSKPHKGKNVDRKSSRQARTPDSSVYLRNMVDRTGGIVLSWMYLIVLLHPPAAYALCFATMNVYSLLQFYIVKYLNIRSFLKTRIRVDVEDVKTPEDNLLKQYETCYRESLQRYRKEIEDRKGKNGGDLFDDPEQNPTKHCDTNEVSDKARQKVDANK